MSTDQQPPSGESDRAFLSRHGVPGLLKEALGRLGTQQPAEPLAFLAEFFSTTEGRRADLEQARACLTQAHWQSPGYLFSVKEGFDCLRRLQRDDCRVHAVCGLHCTQLLEMLLRDAPPAGNAVFMQRMRLRPQAAVQFGRFYSAVMSTLAFKAYMADCVALYADAEVVAAALKPGSNNRAACACLLQLLDSALTSQQQQPQADPGSQGSTGSSLFLRLEGLAPPALQDALSAARPATVAAAVARPSGPGAPRPQAPSGPLGLAEFLAEAAGVFVHRLLT